jgi:hypothetical protein
LLGSFGSLASLLGGGAGLVGAPLGLRDLLVVRQFPGQVGRFLGQVCGLIGRGGCLTGPLGAQPRLFGQVARVVSQAAGLIGLLGGAGLIRAGIRLRGGQVLVRGADAVLVRGADAVLVRGADAVLVLGLDRAPGHVVGFAGLGHALASGDLPGFVLSHDHFFLASRPASARHGETAMTR